MAHIVLADDGIEFDGNSARVRPLGGVESSVIELRQHGHLHHHPHA